MIDEEVLDQLGPISDHKHYLKTSGYGPIQKLKFLLKYHFVFWSSFLKIKKAVRTGKIAIGPFKGEFGNFLGHVLPLLVYLHKRNVVIRFCSFEILQPYLVDESGDWIIRDFVALRDIYKEAPPSTNFGEIPQDVEGQIRSFYDGIRGGTPIIDLGNHFYYWFIHKKLVAKYFSELYDLSLTYSEKSENACAIFPRSKGASHTKNNGAPWNYNDVVNLLQEKFDKVYVVGHPAYVEHIEGSEKVVPVVSSDNEQILKVISKSSHIFSQHSGVIYLAPLLRKRFVLLYNGGEKLSDIGSIQNTLYYLKALNGLNQIDYCFSLQDVDQLILTKTATD